MTIPFLLNYVTFLQENGGYKGVRLASGQEIFSQKLILDPCITVGLESLSSLTDQQKETLRVLVPKAISSKGKIARGICIIRGSVKADTSNALIVYPPKCKIKFEDPLVSCFTDMYSVICPLKVLPSTVFSFRFVS